MGVPRALTRISRRTVLAAVPVLLGLAAACGGGGNDGDSSTASVVPKRANLLGTVSTETSGSRSPRTPEIRVLQAAIGEPVPVLVNINHVPEGQRVDYQDAPPTSGQHWPTPAGCGFYTESLPDERIVHNMEHGNVVVSYNFTNPAQTTELRQALDNVGLFEKWGVARPYDRIPDGQVALSSWGRVHTMTGVNPGEIELFFEVFAGELGPERFTC